MSEKLVRDLTFLKDQVEEAIQAHKELLYTNPEPSDEQTEDLHQVSFNLIQAARTLIEPRINYYQLSTTIAQVGADLAKLSSTLASVLESKEKDEQVIMNGSYPTTPTQDDEPITPIQDASTPTQNLSIPTQSKTIKFLSVPQVKTKAQPSVTARSKTPIPIQPRLIDRPSFDELTVIYGGSSCSGDIGMVEVVDNMDAQSITSAKSTTSSTPTINISHDLTPIPTHHSTQPTHPSTQPTHHSISSESRPKLGKIFIRRKKV
jgi:hypothetical protein